ncbi:MAG: hypothetical protein ACK520_02220 [Inhella sp.]|jgi:hypothetical protein|uniref:hypothetical protein n=1 Tax=Inhella sp. TaxID=1921806 RepID=UPI0022BABE5D|nr:hypothetical protein [Inhella sp.]MCZ8236532.1 hypothetical protein [Inhella sp.]
MASTRYLTRRSAPVVPPAMPVAQALSAHPGLAQLTALARAAQERLIAVKRLTPAHLHGALVAGAVDAEGWTLLVTHAAAAAKLRQLHPQLQAMLQARFGPGILRLKRMV